MLMRLHVSAAFRLDVCPMSAETLPCSLPRLQRLHAREQRSSKWHQRRDNLLRTCVGRCDSRAFCVASAWLATACLCRRAAQLHKAVLTGASPQQLKEGHEVLKAWLSKGGPILQPRTCRPMVTYRACSTCILDRAKHQANAPTAVPLRQMQCSAWR